MTSTHIWLASTSGPVSITSISEEDPAVGSVVCLEGTFKALPISADYDAFVRRPTGIIESLTGHRAYRLDVSAPIDQGKSWQLGFALAHLYDISSDQNQKEIIFTSGQIAPDLSLVPIEFMSQKWEKALPALLKASSEGYAVKIVLHPRNATEIKSEIPSHFTLIEPEHLNQASTALTLPWPKQAGSPPAFLKWRFPIVTILASLALMALILIILPKDEWQKWRTLDEQGRFREMLISLRHDRQNGGWAATNAAYFYENQMRAKSRHLSENVLLTITQSDESAKGCRGAELKGAMTAQLPAWLVRPCQYELNFPKLADNHHIFFAVVIMDEEGNIGEIARISGKSPQITQSAFHFQTPELGARETLYIISLISDRPAFEIYSWFNQIIDNPTVSTEMRQRLERAGIGYQSASLVHESFSHGATTQKALSPDTGSPSD